MALATLVPFFGTSDNCDATTDEATLEARKPVRSELFDHLTREQCADLVAAATRHQFARDKILLMQGEHVHSVMLIEKGAVKLSQVSREGEELTLWVCGPGDSIGMLSQGPRASVHSCTARALKDCTVLRWESTVLERFPNIRPNLDAIIANRLRELEQRFCEMTTASVTRRLAYTLLHLLPKIGQPCPDGMYLPITRDELGRLSGLSMFTVSRTISKWGTEQLVVPRREAVVIRFPERLAELCCPVTPSSNTPQ